MSTVAAISAKPAAYLPGVGRAFTVSPTPDLSKTDKNDFLSLIKDLKESFGPRESNMRQALNDAKTAYDYMEQASKASTGEESYGLLGRVHGRLCDVVAWLNLAQANLKNILDGQLTAQDRADCEAYLEECKKALGQATSVCDKLCARLGEFCKK